VLRNTSAERLVDPQKQSKMCQRCQVHKAVAKVRIGGASEVLKLCTSCLEAMKTPGHHGGGERRRRGEQRDEGRREEGGHDAGGRVA
jgi:hypothetical protein